MNAQTSPTSSLTTVAITNEAALRVLAAAPIVGAAAVAHASGLAQKNMARQLDLLVRDGLVREEAAHDDRGRDAVSFNLTDAGRLALQAMDLAAGRLELGGAGAEPANDVLLLRHHQIRRNPLNARKLDLDNPKHREELDMLKSQIVSAGDVLQNLVVFPADAEGIHDLFAGERRWTAVGELIDEGLWAADRPLRAIQRDNTPGQTAFISLVENSQVALSVMERARAYKTLCEDTGWSGREAALRTGWDVKSVQQYLQVLREADPAHIAAHEAGDPEWNWEALRKSVQKTADVEVQESAQADIEDGAVAFDLHLTAFDRARLPEISAAFEKLSPKHLMVAVEIADKLFRNADTARSEHQPNARVADHYPNDPMRSHDAMPDHYVTPWLDHNWKQALSRPGEPLTGGGASLAKPPGAPRAAAGPDTLLNPVERVAMIELAHKLLTYPDSQDTEGGPLVRAPKYWLDQAASDLTAKGLVVFMHFTSGAPLAGLPNAGKAWVAAHWPNQIGPVDLETERFNLPGGSPHMAPGRYVTPWLNALAAAAPDQEPVHFSDHQGGAENEQPEVRSPENSAVETDERLDDDMLDLVVEKVREALAPTQGEKNHWSNQPSISLAQSALDAAIDGDPIHAIIALAALVRQDHRRQIDADQMLKLAASQRAHGSALLFALSAGDMVSVGGTASGYRLMARQDHGHSQGFLAQQHRLDLKKDYGKPRHITLHAIQSVLPAKG